MGQIATVAAEKITTEKLNAMVRTKFGPPTYGLLQNVADGTGARDYRWADFVAMSLWPSRGLTLIGLECKVSRSDWLKELRSPEKAEAIAQYCDEWYIVAGNKDIVKDGELPPNWGLIIAQKNGLTTRVPAKRLQDPKPINREFLAAMFRRCTEQSAAVGAIEAADAAGYKRGMQNAEWLERDHAELKERVAAFEKSAGFRVGEFDSSKYYTSPQEFAKAFNAVLHRDPDGVKGVTLRMRTQARHAIGRLQDLLNQTSWAEDPVANAFQPTEGQ